MRIWNTVVLSLQWIEMDGYKLAWCFDERDIYLLCETSGIHGARFCFGLVETVVNFYIYFWFKYDLGQKYYAPHVWSKWDLNSWPPDHDSTFHVTEMPAQPYPDIYSNIKLWLVKCDYGEAVTRVPSKPEFIVSMFKQARFHYICKLLDYLIKSIALNERCCTSPCSMW